MNAPIRQLPRNLLGAPVVLPRAVGTGNGSVAPVCPVSRDEAVPGGPGLLLPTPPPAFDLPSAILAINQLRQIVNILINPPPNVNLQLKVAFPKPVWVETNRNMVTQRVFNPDDHSMWVDVQHIAMLDMTDKTTGTAMTLLYNPPKAGGVGTAPTTGGATTPTGPGGPVQTPGQ
jgi:hypothetical protein